MTEQEEKEIERIKETWLSLPFLEKFKKIGSEFFKKLIKEKENGIK